MKAVLILPEATREGNLLWMPPYLYPTDDLEEGINRLKEKGYFVEVIEDGSGLAFRSEHTFDEVKFDFEVTFPWINITAYQKEEEIDFQTAIFDYCLIVLPISRLSISTSIISETVCLFPAGEFQVEQINIQTLDGKDFMSKNTKMLRDHVTNITEVCPKVFINMPLIVFTKKLSFESYGKLTQQEDSHLIKECANYADRMMDLLRYYNGDYHVPEALPAKPGVWSDRYSAMLCYFPGQKFGNVQAREVELKAFSKGVGMDATITDQLGFRLLLGNENDELQNIAKHALKLHSAIQESDNETMKFAHIMVLFDYIGDPFSFGRFQDLKEKFIPCLTTDKAKYEELAERFKELTGGEGKPNPGLRTKIVHMGKSIEELIPIHAEREKLFKEMHNHIYALIRHMIYSPAKTWTEYDIERKALRKLIFPH